MKNKTRKAIYLALILIATYYGYEHTKFSKYQKCMIDINNTQEVAINDCKQILK